MRRSELEVTIVARVSVTVLGRDETEGSALVGCGAAAEDAGRSAERAGARRGVAEGEGGTVMAEFTVGVGWFSDGSKTSALIPENAGVFARGLLL